jgi:hypothetical protein
VKQRDVRESEHLEVTVQEEDKQSGVVQFAAALFKQGMFQCSACGAIKSITLLDGNSSRIMQPCCTTCWPVISWCMKREFVMKKVLDALKDGSIHALLAAEMKKIKQMTTQKPQQEANMQHTLDTSCKQCGLCQRIANLDQFKPTGHVRMSDSTWERPEVKAVLESFCISCRFDRSAPLPL